MLADPAFYAVALPAVILTGLSKGGFSGAAMLSLPLMALVMSPIKAAAIILPVLLVQDMFTVWSYRRTFDRVLLAHVLPGAVAGIGLAWATASYVTDTEVRLVVGLIAVAYCLDALWSRRSATDRQPHNRMLGGLLGTTAGYTSFIANAGGAPFIAYALSRAPSKELLAGSSAVFFATVNVIKMPPFLALGQITRDTLPLSASLLPIAIAANLAGIWLVRRISQAAFYKVILGLTLLVGLKLIADAGQQLLG